MEKLLSLLIPKVESYVDGSSITLSAASFNLCIINFEGSDEDYKGTLGEMVTKITNNLLDNAKIFELSSEGKNISLRTLLNYIEEENKSMIDDYLDTVIEEE